MVLNKSIKSNDKEYSIKYNTMMKKLFMITPHLSTGGLPQFLLEKIEKMGIESLTPEEKDFLDNFEE